MSRRHSALSLALLTIVLLTSACATTIAKQAATPTPSPTATPVLTPPLLTIKPAHPVLWTAHQLPPGLKLTGYNWYGPELAQSDGDTAYLCNLANGQAQVWATHDRAAHWTVAGSVPVASDVAECYLIVDALQPQQALLRTYAPDHRCCGQYSGEIRTYLTSNGGAMWVTRGSPSDVTPIFTSLATLDGVSYALAHTRPHSSCGDCYSALFMSKDHMLTWTRIDSGLFLQQSGRTTRDVERFWLGSSGELLAEGTSNRAGATLEFWRSSDQGAHWIPIEFGKTGVVTNFIVAGKQDPHFWRMCAIYRADSFAVAQPTQQISCTVDEGKTWLDTGGENSVETNPFAQASDGAVLAERKNGALLRVTPGHSAWESLGALPVNGTPRYISGNGAGVLWLTEQPSDSNTPPATVYTASYL